LAGGDPDVKVDPYVAIGEVSALVRAQTVSLAALTDACLARIDALNPRLHAFITVTADAARAAAQAAELDIKAGRWRGPLHGVPVAVKDFYDTAGVKTTAAFERFSNRVPAKDAVVVTRLKDAGAIVIGKTNMDTLGMATTGQASFYGPVVNPWNAEYITGGSSSGSAAAVASGMCYAAVDTDAIGSCRLPAACCGIVGFKGTYGLISTEGILAGEAPPDEMIRWFSHPAVTARRVADAAIVLDSLRQSDAKASTTFGRELHERRLLRIGVATNFKADAHIAAAFARAVDIVGSLGHVVSQTAVPFAGPSTGLRHIQRDRQAISHELFGEIDVVLLPTTTTTVPRTTAARKPQSLSSENTAFANYYGLPAMSVPCGFDPNGLPVGLQIVAKPSADLDVLTIGQQYEQAGGWFMRHPSAVCPF
jgi:aspartyl-tRNA(Asn)/glutamyl-tRNA(Gln) amidotransferase subunit A